MIIAQMIIWIQVILVAAKAFGFLDLNWSLTLLPLIFMTFLACVITASNTVEKRGEQNDGLE